MWLAGLLGAVAIGCYPPRAADHAPARGGPGGAAALGGGAISGCGFRSRAATRWRRWPRTFNAAADRVERLFEAQRRTLASASHELRSPLARLRMAIALLDDGSEIVRGAVADIEELDETVGDLLEVGWLAATDGPADPEEIDLIALAREVADRVAMAPEWTTEIAVGGSAQRVRGDRRLIARLLRNLNRERGPLRRAAAGGLGRRRRPRGLRSRAGRAVGAPRADLRALLPARRATPRVATARWASACTSWPEIARFHGGRAWVEDRKGGGSRFRVALGLRRIPAAVSNR